MSATKLKAVFGCKKNLATFIAKANACDFETPVCGEVVAMVSFTIAVDLAKDFIYSLADRLDGTIYDLS